VSGGHTHALYVHAHGPVHGLAPETKVAALVVFVLAVVTTPPTAVWAFGVHALLLAGAVTMAEIPIRFFASRLLIELPFVLFAVFLPFLGGGERVDLGPLSLSVDGSWAAWNILVKGTLGVGASITLVATTEIPDLLRGLERLKVPAVFVSIAGFMVRYLDVVVAELRRTRTAMAARGYAPRWIGQARALATAGGALFIRSYERGERVYQAMLARGFSGSMPLLGREKATAGDWGVALSLPIAAWLVAITAVTA
jgi:cobalt/nickel transport system permease protein